MINITDEQKEIFKQDSVHKNLVIPFTDKTIATIENDRILSESMSLSEILCDEEQIHFGLINSAQFEVNVANVDKKIIGKEIKPYLAISDLQIPLGIFLIKEVQKIQDKAYKKVVAYDRASLLDRNVDDWYDSLTFPITVKAFRDSLFNYLGLEQVSATLVIDNVTIEKTIENEVNAKTVLSAICELEGCFGRFNRQGKFEYLKLANTKPYSLNHTPSLLRANPTCSDYSTKKIDGIRLYGEAGSFYGYGDTSNIYVVQNNVFLNGKTETELQAIASNLLNNIKDITYIPTGVSIMGQPYLEIGDYVSYDGYVDNLNFYVFNRTMTGTQALKDSIECKGEEYLSVDNGIVSQLVNLNRQTGKLKIDVKATEQGIEAEVSRAKGEEEKLSTKISVTEENIKEEMSKTYATQSSVQSSVQDLQNQIDGAIETYFLSGEPTLTNKPASDWTTTDEKDKHIGDLYYNKTDGKAYRFMYDGETNSYTWVLITDADITKALSDSSQALQGVQEVATNLSTNYSTTTQMNSAIDQKVGEITSRVESVETTVTTVTSTANNAKSLANTANANASSALSKANKASEDASSASASATASANSASASATSASNAQKSATSAQSSASASATSASNAVKSASNAATSASQAKTNSDNAVSTANSAKTIANTASSNASTALSTANTANSTASTANTNATNALNTANTAKNAVDNMQIGGTNLCKNTSMSEKSITTLTTASTIWGSGFAIPGSKTNAVIPYGSIWTTSVWVYLPVAGTIIVDFNNYPTSGSAWGGNDNDLTTVRTTNRFNIPANIWTRLSWTTKNENKSNQNKISLYDVSNVGLLPQSSDITWKYKGIKVEIGNKATDWTPAPEDIQSQIDSVETRVSSAEQKITSDAIVSTVRTSTSYKNDLSGKVSTNEIISKINQTAESVTIDASKINLNGVVTANNNFKILEDGSVEMKNATIDGILSVSKYISYTDKYNYVLRKTTIDSTRFIVELTTVSGNASSIASSTTSLLNLNNNGASILGLRINEYGIDCGSISGNCITNNLTSTSTKSALSANQGKVLNDKITTINNSLMKYYYAQFDSSVNTLPNFTNAMGLGQLIYILPNKSIFSMWCNDASQVGKEMLQLHKEYGYLRIERLYGDFCIIEYYSYNTNKRWRCTFSTVNSVGFSAWKEY